MLFITNINKNIWIDVQIFAEKNKMIQILIYVNEDKQAEDLLVHLLKQQLIAKGTLDKNNRAFFMMDGKVKEEIRTVVTVQTRATLFSTIEQQVLEFLGQSVPIYSLPITQANSEFANFIRFNTLTKL